MLLQKFLRLETGSAVHGIGIDIQVLAVIQKAIHIPIILITSRDDDANQFFHDFTEPDAYVKKPFEFPSEGYQGEYIIEIAKNIANNYGESLEQNDEKFLTEAEKVIFGQIKNR